MDNTIIEELRERISTEPSVLFLGQDYLSSKTGTNIFYHLANETLCRGELPSRTDFTELWKTVNNGKPLDSSDFEKLRGILPNIPEQRWLRKLLCMRWGMIMTSSVDGAMYQCVGNNFSMQPISMDQRSFSRNFISKKTLKVSFLYGTIDGRDDNLPLCDCSKNSFMSIRKKVNDRIDWIYSEILSEYGILVIDGWHPEYDWMKTLLDNAGEMPYGSIFLFGATDDILANDDINTLVENGILKTDSRTFAQALDEIGFFDDELEESVLEEIENGRLVTVKFNKEIVPITIPFDAIAKLDSHITVLYDDIWFGRSDSGVETDKLYAQFQQQSDTPVWHLYNSKYGFYFDRTQDKQLKEIVEKELSNSSYKRKYVILEGNSNTGKTASLIHLAYSERNTSPVIFISGEPNQPEWMERLKEFIKIQFVEKQHLGKWIDSILVIWDANTDYNAVQRCKQLQGVLRECNTVVVGSAYPIQWNYNSVNTYYKDTMGNHHLILTANLDQVETTDMLKSLKEINQSIYESMRNSMGKTPYLLHVLQKIIHLEYREEWKQVSAALQSRFNQEVYANEGMVDAKLEEYIEKVAQRVNDEILRYGIASSWQLKLAQIKEQLGASERIEPEKKEKLKKFEHMEKHIQKLNSILSVAGEFSINLPLTLILRMLGDGEQRILSDEQMFLINIIQSDSLLRSVRDEDGYISVSFRHPIEAEMYIRNNFGGSAEEIKENEVAIIRKMIAECKWVDEQESLPVLALVRSFGPNSWGTLSHPRGKNMRRYSMYENWWKSIAIELRNAAEDQPEVILVYALFVRSHCRTVVDKLKNDITISPQEFERCTQQCMNDLNDAKEMLRNVIEQHDQNNKNQYCRLLGEMCANLVFGMRETNSAETEIRYFQLKDYFARTVKNWADNNSQNMFTRNALLDIWLNGVDHYFAVKVDDGDPMENPECAAAVADSVNYIDELLDLAEDDFDSSRLLEKVDTMYNYVGSNHLPEFQEKLERSNNDTFLYLMAWKCWRNNGKVDFVGEENDYLKNIAKNLYLIPDDLDRLETKTETILELKKHAKEAAINAIAILDEKKNLIDSSRSTRCISMMIRSKWLVYTGNMPLETKQNPILTIDQWREIGELCEKYVMYADRGGQQLRTAPVLLRMIYVWCFSKNKDEFDNLRNRQNMLRTNDWYFERICLCNPGTEDPKCFYVNLQLRRGTNNKYNATVVSSAEEKAGKIKDAIELNVAGKQVHVPESVAQALMGNEFGSEKFNIDQPVVIWFNAKGPQIGLPRTKGGK